MLFIKAFTSYFHIYRPPHTTDRSLTPSSAIIIGLHQRRGASPSRKTAEERFNMLARGWLAYPVTPTHHTSTAEERLYNRHPLVCTLSSQSDGTLP